MMYGGWCLLLIARVETELLVLLLSLFFCFLISIGAIGKQPASKSYCSEYSLLYFTSLPIKPRDRRHILG